MDTPNFSGSSGVIYGLITCNDAETQTSHNNVYCQIASTNCNRGVSMACTGVTGAYSFSLASSDSNVSGFRAAIIGSKNIISSVGGSHISLGSSDCARYNAAGGFVAAQNCSSTFANVFGSNNTQCATFIASKYCTSIDSSASTMMTSVGCTGIGVGVSSVIVSSKYSTVYNASLTVQSDSCHQVIAASNDCISGHRAISGISAGSVTVSSQQCKILNTHTLDNRQVIISSNQCEITNTTPNSPFSGPSLAIAASNQSIIDEGRYSAIISSKESNIKTYGNNSTETSTIIASNKGKLTGNNFASYSAIIASNDCYGAGTLNTIVSSKQSYISSVITSIFSSYNCSAIGGFSTNIIFSSENSSFIGNNVRRSAIISSNNSYIRGNSDYHNTVFSSQGSSIKRNGNRYCSVIASQDCSVDSDLPYPYGAISHCAMIACQGPTGIDGARTVALGTTYSNFTSDSVRVTTINTNGKCTTSDQDLKKDIELIKVDSNILEKVEKVQVHSFNFQRDPPNQPPNFGFITQEMSKTFPELVKDKDFNQYPVTKKYGNWYLEDKILEQNRYNQIEIDHENPNYGKLIDVKESFPQTLETSGINVKLWASLQLLMEENDKLHKLSDRLISLLASI